MRDNGIEIAEKKATAMVSPAVKPMTAAEYFLLPETMRPERLLNGVYERLPTPPLNHQRTLGDLYLSMGKRIPNGEVLPGPLDVVFDDCNVLQPDVLWLAKPSRCQVIEGRLYGPPELIAEVMCNDSARYDRRDKFDLYERHGVPEYWIVDLDVRAVEVWSLQNGVYERLGNFLSGSPFESPALGGQRVETAPIFPPAE